MVHRYLAARVNILDRFPFLHSGRPKKTGSGQFYRHYSPIPALWPTGAGELNGSDP